MCTDSKEKTKADFNLPLKPTRSAELSEVKCRSGLRKNIYLRLHLKAIKSVQRSTFTVLFPVCNNPDRYLPSIISVTRLFHSNTSTSSAKCHLKMVLCTLSERDSPQPIQFFNNLLAETQLSIKPWVNLHFQEAKREMGVQTFAGQRILFHLRQQQTCISEENSRPWVTVIQAFTLLHLQATAGQSFLLSKNLGSGNMSRVLESSNENGSREDWPAGIFK